MRSSADFGEGLGSTEGEDDEKDFCWKGSIERGRGFHRGGGGAEGVEVGEGDAVKPFFPFHRHPFVAQFSNFHE